MYTELFPIITTPDLERALHFYRDLLGGKVSHEIPGDDGALVYVGIDIGSSHMGIGRVAEPGEVAARPISLWLYAHDRDAAVERLRSNDVQIVEELRERPWQERVARVQDPDGNVIIIGELSSVARRSAESLGASLISPEPERYTRQEYERRFLVARGSGWRELVEPYSKTFDDLYIRRSYLRLRTLWDSASGTEFIKLTKKLPSTSPYVQLTGSIPISPMEYELISGLEGDRIRKVRYYHFFRGSVFSIDAFQEELAGLVLCEVEANDMEELMAIALPAYTALEVTDDPFFSGGNLARTSRSDLLQRLTEIDQSYASGI